MSHMDEWIDGMDDMDLPEDNLILKVGEEEIGKEGLKQNLIKEGEGWETSESGDKLTILKVFS